MTDVDIFKVVSETPESEPYVSEYAEFMEGFKAREVAGEEVGELIAKFGYYFAGYNIRMINALKTYSEIRAAYMSGLDETTGKPMSAAKAETMSDATPEAAKYYLARAHVQNIEQCINALKALQKGVLNEYARS